MDVMITEIQQAPMRETIRDARGSAIGTVERQRQTWKLVARDKSGVIVGIYDPRANETRDSRGRAIGRANLLAALLYRGR